MNIESRTVAFNNIYEAHLRSDTAEVKWKGENAYSRGFVLTPTESEPPTCVKWWPRISCDHYTLRLFPGLRWAHRLSHNGAHVIVLGTAFGESSQQADNDAVALRIARNLNTEDLNNTLDYATTLSGRFAIIVINNQRVIALNDPTGAQALYWIEQNKCCILASHDKLVAEVCGGLSNDNANRILHAPEYQSSGGKALPGLITGHDGVLPVLPNCYLDYRPNRWEHRRFYPRTSLRELTREEAIEAFGNELRRQIKLWLATDDQPFIGLTAGRDSKTVLATGLDLFQASKATALTYHFFERNPTSTHTDLLTANRIANDASLRHRIFDIEAMTASSPAGRAYNSTFKGYARFPTLAGTFYNQLPWRSSFFNSLCAEVGTGFYTDRSGDISEPATMAKKFTQSEFAKSPQVLESFEEYAAYTQLDQVPEGSLDPFDLFYCEWRLGKWAAIWYSELDLSTNVALPLNSRKLFEIMQSQPLEYRHSGGFYRDLWKSINSPFTY